MTAAVPRKKRHFAALQRAQNIGVRRIAERRLMLHFLRHREPGMVYSPLPPMIPISACGK